MLHHQATDADPEHNVITAGLTCCVRLNTLLKHDELGLSAACQRKSRVMYCYCAVIKHKCTSAISSRKKHLLLRKLI